MCDMYMLPVVFVVSFVYIETRLRQIFTAFKWTKVSDSEHVSIEESKLYVIQEQ